MLGECVIHVVCVHVHGYAYVCVCVCVCLVAQSCQTLATPWIVAHQALLSMGFSRQEYWSGLSFPSLGDLPNPGIKLVSPALAARFFTTGPPGKFSIV